MIRGHDEGEAKVLNLRKGKHIHVYSQKDTGASHPDNKSNHKTNMKQTILFFTDFAKQKVETCIRGLKKFLLFSGNLQMLTLGLYCWDPELAVLLWRY